MARISHVPQDFAHLRVFLLYRKVATLLQLLSLILHTDKSKNIKISHEKNSFYGSHGIIPVRLLQ